MQQIKKTGTIAVRKATAKQGRTRFNNILKECQEMLSYMGLECIQGNGEAEAMCAYLNSDGVRILNNYVILFIQFLLFFNSAMELMSYKLFEMVLFQYRLNRS